MSARTAAGVTLVELMISMTLGLLVVGACGHLYLASLGSANATLGVSRVQESGRLALELLGRDIRSAGDLLCHNGQPVGNLLAERNRAFWTSYEVPLKGAAGAAGTHFEDPSLVTGTAEGQRLATMPALRLWTVQPLPLAVSGAVASDQPLPVTGAAAPAVGTPLLVCDFAMAALFRVTASGATLGHGTPANCVGHFAASGTCAADTPIAARHRFGADTAFGVPRQVRWFVGNDEDGVPSLYRQELVDGLVVGGGALIAGVSGFSLSYLLAGEADYVGAAQINDAQWAKVQAVAVQLQVQDATGAAAEGPVQRDFEQTFSVRARLP